MSVRYCYDNEEEEITDKLGSEPAIYLFETTTENSPMVNPELTTEQKRQLDELMDEFKDVFSDAPGTTTKAEHSIWTRSTRVPSTISHTTRGTRGGTEHASGRDHRTIS